MTLVKSRTLFIVMIILIYLQGCHPENNHALQYTYTSSLPTDTYSINNYSPSFPSTTSQMSLIIKTSTAGMTQTTDKFSTPTPSPYPISKSTPIPTVDGMEIPQWVIDHAGRTGMTPYEIMYIFTTIRTAVIDNQPRLLLDFLQFPLHTNGGCPGDVIETPEEFIDRFPELFDEQTRKDFSNMSSKSIVIHDAKVGLGVVRTQKGIDYFDSLAWYGHVCISPKCDENKIIFFRLLDYVTYWERVDGYSPLAPPYELSEFAFGRYEAIAYEDTSAGGAVIILEENNPWKMFTVTITEKELVIDPFSGEGTGTFAIEKLEVCQNNDDEPQWYGYTKPYLLIYYEGNNTISNIYILSDDQIAVWVNHFISYENVGTYIILELIA